jgi:hypothetical protein
MKSIPGKVTHKLFDKNGKPALVVFSHPNHELAVFGLLQRLKPNIIYLTDGGGRQRVEETKAGLGRIGLLDQATFLNHSEESFYQALIARDHAFFDEVKTELGALLETLEPGRIFCDAVEFYNPVHDLSLPIVRAAIPSADDVSLFEVPLVYQKKTESEEYEVQRLPLSRRDEQAELQLTAEELDHKVHARDFIYSSLAKQMGPLLSELPRGHTALEVVTPAALGVPEPREDQTLRYEWRAELLRTRGEITTAITYANHYLPVASELLHAHGPLSSAAY